MAVVGVERRDLLRADATRERIVVVARNGDHREDVAVLRVQGDPDALGELVLEDTLSELAVEELLEAVVDREDHGVADRRRPQREGLDLTLRRVALDLAPAVGAAKIFLVGRLETGATDVVVEEVPLLAEIVELALGHRAGVADDRRVQLAVLIEADASRFHADAREELAPLADRYRDLPRDGRRGDAHRLVGVALALRRDRALDRLRGQSEQRAEA